MNLEAKLYNVNAGTRRTRPSYLVEREKNQTHICCQRARVSSKLNRQDTCLTHDEDEDVSFDIVVC